MRARTKIAALVLATAVGAAAQSTRPLIYTDGHGSETTAQVSWPRIYADKHGSETKLEAINTTNSFSAQQTSTPAGTSSSKQRTTAPQTAPSTSKPTTTKPNTQSGTASKAGAAASRTSLTANWTKYCPVEGDFCVKYPTTWEPLGDSADSGGLVIAPAQPNKPPAQWSNVTVMGTDLPQPPAGKERPTFDELIGVVLESMRPGVHPQTLERKQMTLDGLPAQFLKLKYVEDGRPWIEEIVLIDGEDVVYSMALRCTPDELPSFEPIFREIVGTWKSSG